MTPPAEVLPFYYENLLLFCRGVCAVGCWGGSS